MTLSPDNKVIQGLWKGRPLSNMERLCIHSFIANGHEFHLYLYEDPGGIPEIEGLKIFDANDILPQKKANRPASAAYASDWFRWELMRQKGGWYADMDMVCLRPCNFADPIVFGAESEQYCSSAIMKFPVNHALVRKLAGSCAAPRRIVPWDDEAVRKSKWRRKLWFWKDPYASARWGEAGGPDGFTRALKHFDMAFVAQPKEIFYPIDWWAADRLIDTQLHDQGLLAPMLERTTVVHLWSYMWGKENRDRDAIYPRDSLYEVLKKRYLPPADCSAQAIQ